jgi:hypothetical protein
MSTLDLEFDLQMNNLETEWRQVYEASIIARTDYHSLASNPDADSGLLDLARERLERAEALKDRIMWKIESLEERILGQD